MRRSLRLFDCRYAESYSVVARSHSRCEEAVPVRLKHENSGRCLRCLEIINTYPNFHAGLRDWFTATQGLHLPEMHVAEAGRGREQQELMKQRGLSRAHYGESAHNYNCAIDIFEQGGIRTNIYEQEWFEQKLKPHLPDFLSWYGEKGAVFFELPHIEVRAWRNLVTQGAAKLVE